MELDQDAFSEVFMIPLSSAISSGLTWSNIARNRGYELRLTCEVVSTLRRPGFFRRVFWLKLKKGIGGFAVEVCWAQALSRLRGTTSCRPKSGKRSDRGVIVA